MTFANNLHHAFQEWSPTIDGVELTADPRLLMAAGERGMGQGPLGPALLRPATL